ncbi:MAG: FAD-binding oxidoreductase [Clostridiales bacterium]|nr:FAD-binding oxidoreductase [Clostridiales bacterium]
MELIRKLTPGDERYLSDESRVMGAADYIAFPASAEEISSVIRWCVGHDVPLTAQGGLTGLAGGASPARGLALNLQRMNRILGLRRDDQGKYALRVQPGLLLTQLRKALETKSFDVRGWDEASLEALKTVKPGALFFSPDPTEPTASLGGMASCNACGARSFLYGCTRAHINALRVVLSDGRIASLARGRDQADGRHVRFSCEDGSIFECELPSFDTPPIKDAGFFIRENMDLVDLFMGSQGTLGIIAELELKLMDAPRHLWGLTAFFPDDENALAYVRAMKGHSDAGVPDFAYRPASIEFFNKNALDMVVRQKAVTPAFHQLQELPENYNCAVYVEFNDDDPGEMIPVLRALSAVIQAVGGDIERTWVARDAAELEKLLFFRHTVPETIDLIVEENRKREPCITILSTDMAVDDRHFDELFHIYKHDLMQTNLQWIIFGHIGENHVHPNILARTKAEYEEGHRIFEKWARDVHRMGGSISAEHGAGKIKKRLAQIMYGADKMRELAALKRAFDPKGLLGPGNVISEE